MCSLEKGFAEDAKPVSNQVPTQSVIYWPFILWSIHSVPEVSPARGLWAHASNPNKKLGSQGAPWAQVCSRSKELVANTPIRLLRMSPGGCSSQKHKHLPTSSVLGQLWLNGREESQSHPRQSGLAQPPSLSPATSPPFCSQIFFSCGLLFFVCDFWSIRELESLKELQNNTESHCLLYSFPAWQKPQDLLYWACQQRQESSWQ